MKDLRSHFVFNRSQQNGIFVLVVVIIVLQLLYFFYPFSSEIDQTPREEDMVRKMQASVDSLKQVAAKKDTLPPAAFNPNFISDYRGYMLGMSVEEIDRLHRFRARGLWVNSPEEFQKVTGVSDSLLQQISPAFQFPQFRQNTSEANGVQENIFSAPLPKADLNLATAEALKKINGIGEKLSERIVNYRSSLGGFRGNAQVKDVYGLSPEVVERLLQQFEVKSSAVEKVDINSATVMDLVEIPYLNYEQARAIIKYREGVQEIHDYEELGQIRNFPMEKLDRIQLYLTINREN